MPSSTTPPAAPAVTLEEIARRLNLSAATVSRSLRHDPLIHPATRARVNEAAAAMGYQGRARRGPRSGANGAGDGAAAGEAAGDGAERTLGGGGRAATGDGRRMLAVLVASGDLGRARHHGNFMRLLEGITAECDGTGAIASIHTLPPSPESRFGDDPERAPAVLRDRLCDAAIVTGNIAEADIALIARLAPTVTLSRLYEGVSADAVLADNFRGTLALVRRLTALGHRRLAFVGDTYEASFFAERRAGFLEGCAAAGIARDARLLGLRGGEGTAEGGDWNRALLRLLREDGVTGFVCANDLTAYYALAAFEEAGVRVPEDASVTGFDGVSPFLIPLKAVPPPSDERRVTSIDPNFVEMGRCAVRLALQRLTLAAVPPLRLTVAGNVIDGDTVGPPPTGAAA